MRIKREERRKRFNKRIGGILKKIRLDNKKTMKDFCKIIDKTQGWYSKYERGEKEIRLIDFLLILRKLKIKLKDLHKYV